MPRRAEPRAGLKAGLMAELRVVLVPRARRTTNAVRERLINCLLPTTSRGYTHPLPVSKVAMTGLIQLSPEALHQLLAASGGHRYRRPSS